MCKKDLGNVFEFEFNRLHTMDRVADYLEKGITYQSVILAVIAINVDLDGSTLD
ncbi:MAG: hypothetical protein O9264_02570 [Leptospira sp.]|nr:hypothetical protein [Leptospira sp.]